jgi:hypothetical protein
MGVTSHQLIYHRQRSVQKLKRERREEKKQKVKPTFDCYMPDKNQEWNVSSTLLSTTMLCTHYFSFIIYISDGMLRTPLLTFSAIPTPN